MPKNKKYLGLKDNATFTCVTCGLLTFTYQAMDEHVTRMKGHVFYRNGTKEVTIEAHK